MSVRPVLCILALTCALAAAAQSRLTPFEYQSNFQPNPGVSLESGSRDGWESYPITQETGYEPTLNPETSHGDSSLVRETAPTQDGSFQLGFIRRMNLVAGPKASLHFWISVPYANGAMSMSVSVFRGTNEERLAASITGSDWQHIDLPVAASSARVTALAIAVDFPHAIHGRPERVMLRDVRFKALATKRLDLEEPAALWDSSRELYYFKRAVHPGDTLHVSLGAPSTEKVSWTFTAPDGRKVVKGIGKVIGYPISPSAPIGVWTLHASSNDAETTALLLVSPGHPRGILFDQAPAISAELLASVRKRREELEATAHLEAGRNIASMDEHWLLAGLPSYFSALLQSPEIAMLDAIDFRVTGNRAALDEARTLLTGIAKWPAWTHPWFPAHGYHSYYPVGIMTKYVVIAEQFLGNDLSTEQRLDLDKSLMDLAVKPIYEEYVQEDRLQFNTSNWIGNTVGGALLGALQSDSPDAAGYALGLYIKERDHVAAAYTSDGSYGEGVTYHRFDLEMTTLVAQTAKRVLGQSLDKRLQGGERYMRYAAYGKDGLLDYGDSHVDITPSNVFAYMAAQNSSDALADFYFKYRDTGTMELLSRVLWESQIKKPASTPASGTLSKLFDQRGIVVLRSDWSPDATVIAMRAGKNFNHNHADEGSIFFASGGKLWLGEAGYADYYKDPSYSTFNIQAIGHNTLLLDGKGESQVFPGNAVFGKAPSMEHCILTDEASLVQADLTSAYLGDLKSYTRTLFYQPYGPLFVIDRVRFTSPHTITQVWHPKQQVLSVETSRNAFTLTDGEKRLQVRAFSTIPMTAVQRQSPMPLTSYEQAEHGLVVRPIRVEFTSTSPQTEATVVTVIRPFDVKSTETPIASSRESAQGFVVELGPMEVQVNDESSADASHPETSVTARWGNGMLLLRGKRLQDKVTGGVITFSAPVDLHLTRERNDEVRLEVEASISTELDLENFEYRSEPATHSPGSQPNTLRLAKGHSSIILHATGNHLSLCALACLSEPGKTTSSVEVVAVPNRGAR